MSTINFNDSAAAAALNSMSSAAEGLNTNTKNYASTLENDVFANLSGEAVQKFISQSQVHCENLGKIAKDLNEIINALNSIKSHHADKDTSISRI